MAFPARVPLTTDALITLLPQLRRVAVGMTGDEALADDLVQQALLNASRTSHWEEANPGWWVTIIRNSFRSWLRAEKRRRRREEQVVNDPSSDCTSVLSDETETTRTLAMLRDAIGSLPPELRKIVETRYIDGLSFEQIARQRGISSRSVRRANENALSQLRHALSPACESDSSRPRRKTLGILWPGLFGGLGDRLRPNRRRLRWLAAVAATAAFVAVLPIRKRPGFAIDPVAPTTAWNNIPQFADTFATGEGLMEEASNAASEDAEAHAETPSLSTQQEGLLPEACPSLQGMIDRAQAGTTIFVPPCIYRETIRINHALALVASEGAEIRGSDIWENFTPHNHAEGAPARWVSERSLSVLPQDKFMPTTCHTATSGPCADGQQVFVDGEALQRVANVSDVGPSTFALDTNRHVVIGINPVDHVVEVSVRGLWVDVLANDVSIEGFIMRHSANLGIPGGALYVHGGARAASIKRNHLRLGSGVCMSVEGDAHRVANNEISQCGWEAMQVAASSVSAPSEVANNAIHDNGSLAKMAKTRWVRSGITLIYASARVMNNQILANGGMGIFMVHSTGTTVRGNTIEGNGGAGIAGVRLTHSLVEDNTLRSNGANAWPREPAIMLVRTSAVDIRKNVIESANQAIVVAPEIAPKIPPPGSCLDSTYNNLYDNTIKTLGDVNAIALLGVNEIPCPLNRATYNNVTIASR